MFFFLLLFFEDQIIYCFSLVCILDKIVGSKTNVVLYVRSEYDDGDKTVEMKVRDEKWNKKLVGGERGGDDSVTRD